MKSYSAAISRASLVRALGRVRQITGSAIEASGPAVAIGDLCDIYPLQGGKPVLAEVVGIKATGPVLMSYGSLQGIAAGCAVESRQEQSHVKVGPGLLGRIIDGFGSALDGRGDPFTQEQRPLRPQVLNPMHRAPIDTLLPTGVRVVDTLLPLGRGQRIGIFAGSGVGKSTLLGMVARNVQADVNVIALIGERGREVRDFVEKQLGEHALARSVVVVATSDQPALVRLRATYSALAIAEYFRAQGKDVLLTMDSVTRFAMARREVGLSAGEPPTARGYTPSVFTEIPELCERCGRLDGAGGSITGIFTVLVEGDDFNEPVADTLRATLDGHVVLTRTLAHRGHYPAIDPLRSASRLLTDLTTTAERALIGQAVDCLALLDRNKQLVDIGAYQSGTNIGLDAALSVEEAMIDWQRQDAYAPQGRDVAMATLGDIVRRRNEFITRHTQSRASQKGAA